MVAVISVVAVEFVHNVTPKPKTSETLTPAFSTTQGPEVTKLFGHGLETDDE